MNQQIILAVDAMGGDNAPGAIVAGCVLALAEQPDIVIELYGAMDRVKPLLPAEAEAGGRLLMVDAPDVIDNTDSPVMAIRQKPKSSLVMALEAVKAGRAAAMVSAGSTGALLAGGLFRVGRIRGIERPALAVIIPGSLGPFVLTDCGSNVDCKPEYLAQFGQMGSVYAQKVLGVSNPRVALANIGAEAEKGNNLVKAAFELMGNQPYNFVGNIEARDIPAGAADVVVADGFVGNMILKHTEGMAATLMSMLKQEMMASARAKLGALLMKPGLRAFKKKMDYTEYGGAPLLGVNGVLIKAHGSSGDYAFKSAIGQAVRMARGGVVEAITEYCQQQEENHGI